jgi:hypothetical protein
MFPRNILVSIHYVLFLQPSFFVKNKNSHYIDLLWYSSQFLTSKTEGSTVYENDS